MAELKDFRIALVTPYIGGREAWLRQCHESVRAQTHPCTHILVADGEPNPEIDSWDAQHIVLRHRHDDWGDTPRGVGAASAVGQHFDGIAFLDDDNWLEPDHAESLVALHASTKAPICTSRRILNRVDGSRMGTCGNSDGEGFSDSNCVIFFGEARNLALGWPLVPDGLHPIGDRVIWLWILRSKLPRAHSGLATLHYRTSYANHYYAMKEAPPPEAKSGIETARALKIARRLGFGELVQNKLVVIRD